jgi:hypothetical protein
VLILIDAKAPDFRFQRLARYSEFRSCSGKVRKSDVGSGRIARYLRLTLLTEETARIARRLHASD